MNQLLEKFEQQFEGLKAGTVTSDELFNSVSANIFALRAEALPFVKRLYAWAKETEEQNRKLLGLVTIIRCQIAMHDERIEDGLALTLEARRIFSDLNDEDGLALADTMTGLFYRTLGNIDIALKAQYSVCNVLKASGKYPFFYTAGSYQLAELYIETKAYERAITTYEECNRAAGLMGYMGFGILALDGLAVAYHYTGKTDLAKETFVKALACSEGNMFITQRTRVLSDYGTLWLNEGNYTKAVDCHREAMELRLAANMLLAAITNMIQIGKAYKLQNDLTAALNIWQRALDSAIQINAKPKISQVHLLLSEFYDENQDSEKALYHYKAYHTISEEVTREDGNNKVKRAEILFAAGQTEKENAIIKAQKAEIERKNHELQETIDELTITKVSRRAKALTLAVAVVMILVEEPIVHVANHYIGEENFYFSMLAKVLIVLSLKPIDSAIEHLLLSKIILKKRKAVVL